MSSAQNQRGKWQELGQMRSLEYHAEITCLVYHAESLYFILWVIVFQDTEQGHVQIQCLLETLQGHLALWRLD